MELLKWALMSSLSCKISKVAKKNKVSTPLVPKTGAKKNEKNWFCVLFFFFF